MTNKRACQLRRCPLLHRGQELLRHPSTMGWHTGSKFRRRRMAPLQSPTAGTISATPTELENSWNAPKPERGVYALALSREKWLVVTIQAAPPRVQTQRPAATCLPNRANNPSTAAHREP